ncbi:hypothetical protein C8N46_103384 [Kordia periserrulae]|uniref:Uncharacterized protein n=1 Tax=Kordia periserrulae TaxID=701523 RepID=A0A2T6C1T8_9FLAO|nr:hypothetical protein [Kordia periserrulae]PTX62284.1 hypothetical protein C8N46_103384 [Kordia periserrulae]
MLQNIKNLEGVTAIPKKQQQKLIAGMVIDGYSCLGGEIIKNCNSSNQNMHPEGHPFCCNGGLWVVEGPYIEGDFIP